MRWGSFDDVPKSGYPAATNNNENIDMVMNERKFIKNQIINPNSTSRERVRLFWTINLI